MFEQIPFWGTLILPLTIFLLCNMLGIIISRTVFSRIVHLLPSESGPFQEVIVQALKGMPVIWGILIGSYGAIHIIGLNDFRLRILENMAIFIGVVSLTVIMARLGSGTARVYAKKAEGIFPSASILAHLVEISIYIIGTLILLQTFGISITPILTALGVGGLAVALALQDTLSNLFSGLHILLSKQIKVGDYIKLNSGEEGNIVDISWRNTTIQALANNIIVVPNQKIASAIITNYFIPNKELSLLVPVGVSYDSDLETVERVTIEVAKEVMADIEGTVKDFEPAVRFHTFGDFSINFNVGLRSSEFVNQYKLKHEFIKRLHKRYREEGIEIPFPVRTVYTKQLE
jgi:small-conductance mechanosensitive channel